MKEVGRKEIVKKNKGKERFLESEMMKGNRAEKKLQKELFKKKRIKGWSKERDKEQASQSGEG